MICDSVRLEARGGSPLSAEQRAHVLGCPTCREEVREAELLRAAMSAIPSPDVSAHVRASVQAELSASAPVRPWWIAPLVASALPVAVALMATGAMSQRPDWGGLEVGWKMGVPCVAVLAFALGTAAAFRPGLRMPWALPTWALVATTAGLVLLSPGIEEAGGIHPGCLVAGLVVSALPLAGLLAVLRREELSARRGLLAGLAAGALGALVLFHHCPDARLEHLVPFHLGAWVAIGALGGALGSRLRKPMVLRVPG
jgi:hypothetical protein